MDLRDITEFFKDFGKYIITMGVIVIVFVFIVALQPVAGNSMIPTLEEGAVVVVFKINPNLKRNQIVVVKGSDNKSYIKRIIGLPGEKIDYLNGILYINDRGYEETFLDDSIQTSNFLFDDICSNKDCPNGVIPDGMYLLLGDNRSESVDSRTPDFGLRSKKDIKGKVILKIWPINKMGFVK